MFLRSPCKDHRVTALYLLGSHRTGPNRLSFLLFERKRPVEAAST